jgi:hypothetical protein
MTRFRNTSIVAAAAVLLVSTSAWAQVIVTNFTPAASPASWGDHANWTITNGININQNFAPDGTFNETAVINGGQTAQVTAAFDGSTSPRGPGQISVTNGKLEIQDTGSLTLVEPASGSLVNRSVTINDRLSVLGNGKLNAKTLTFGASSNTGIQLSAAANSPINIEGLASLNGTLALDYTGYAGTGPKTIITAGTTLNNFTNVTTTGLSAAQAVVINNKNGLVTATRANVPTLTVNRDNGAVTLQNTHGVNIPLDGLSIKSSLGALDPTKFSGLPNAGWTQTGANTINGVTQLYEGPNPANPSFAYAPGAPTQIGANGLFNIPAPTFFLQETEDVVFEVTDPSIGLTPIRGVVNYTGTKVVNNNIVLTINNSGQAAMLNQSPFPQDIEMYRITSTGSPLQTDTWNPLANQSGLDNDTWSVSATSNTTTLLEVTENGASYFGVTDLYNIGQILDPGFSQAGLKFEFLINGASDFTTGAIVFGNHPVPPSALGDFNGDSRVDAADYTVWRDNLGSTSDASILNRGDQIAGVSAGDYNIWKQNFGKAYGTGSGAFAAGAQVPEPSTLVLLAMCVGGSFVSRQRIL